MEDGPPMFKQDFSCPDLLFSSHMTPFAYGAITLYGWPFQTVLLDINAYDFWALPRSLATT